MINPNLLTDDLAQQIAIEVCKPRITEKATDIFKQLLISQLKETLKEDEKKRAHDELFNALFKAINPYERKFKKMITDIWDEEKRIIIANLKKMKKAWLTKDKVDEVMYPVAVFEKKLADGTTQLFIKLMEKEGQRVVGIYDFDIIFDVENPEVQKWLKSYAPKFSKKLEKVNVEKLRAELIEGMNAGEGVRELTSRIYETYSEWGFRRARDIAQNQVLRASNRAAIETYRQSGVVEKKIWITYRDGNECDFCAELDGKVVGVSENYFDLGDEFNVETEGKRQTMKIDYEDIGSPPIHNRCRCAIGPMIEEV